MAEPLEALIVDDERQIVKLVEINLKKAGCVPLGRSYNTTLRYDGQDAWDYIVGQYTNGNPLPDIIVLDIMMPRMNGIDVLRKIRAHEDPKISELSVIMLTAKAQDADIFTGWQSGADSYLTKPFNPRELVLFANRILEAKYSPRREEGAGETIWDV